MKSVFTKVKGCTKSVEVVISGAWRSDSTQCLTITLQSFANAIKVSFRNAAVPNLFRIFIYLC